MIKKLIQVDTSSNAMFELTPKINEIIDVVNSLQQDYEAEQPTRPIEPVLAPPKVKTPESYRSYLKMMVERMIFLPKNGETYCNFFVRDIAREWFGYPWLNNKTANQMYTFMLGNQHWVQYSWESGIRLVNEGKLVLACRDDQPHGHICVVAPEPAVGSGKWGMTTGVPQCANVGKENFYGKGLNYAFGMERPILFVLTNWI